ncbi:MAG: pyridoxine 5'-phosphate synthase [Planctomycetia bacterium]|nr:pyridoxine 5'-phosphate synthase [Planctomycetia bacterium]
MVELGVNIDHIATVREARKTNEPEPVWAAALAELGGADGITVHLREDRRHIQTRDVEILRKTVTAKLNLEMACNPEVLEIACRVRPEQATLVPERREELTTEGGLDILSQKTRVHDTMKALQDAGIGVSLFLAPDLAQIEMAKELGAQAVEIHTGHYANTVGTAREHELEIITVAAAKIRELGMKLHAGHGLTYHNVLPICRLPDMQELNIGHSIISRALMVGMTTAVREMKELINQ